MATRTNIPVGFGTPGAALDTVVSHVSDDIFAGFDLGTQVDVTARLPQTVKLAVQQAGASADTRYISNGKHSLIRALTIAPPGTVVIAPADVVAQETVKGQRKNSTAQAQAAQPAQPATPSVSLDDVDARMQEKAQALADAAGLDVAVVLAGMQAKYGPAIATARKAQAQQDKAQARIARLRDMLAAAEAQAAEAQEALGGAVTTLRSLVG